MPTLGRVVVWLSCLLCSLNPSCLRLPRIIQPEGRKYCTVPEQICATLMLKTRTRRTNPHTEAEPKWSLGPNHFVHLRPWRHAYLDCRSPGPKHRGKQHCIPDIRGSSRQSPQRPQRPPAMSNPADRIHPRGREANLGDLEIGPIGADANGSSRGLCWANLIPSGMLRCVCCFHRPIVW